MKNFVRFFALMLAMLCMVGCVAAEDEIAPVTTYADFVAAELQTPVSVNTYIQAKQDWWDNKATFYTQNEDGAYFIYEMPCTEEEYNLLVPGTRIHVEGYKGEFAGEIEIVDATFEILGDGFYLAPPVDLTDYLGTDELVLFQNFHAIFRGLTVEAIEYKNGEPGDDIYVTVSKDGQNYDFCVERYLTGPDTAVYQTVGTLKAGDVIDVEGYVYWYNGVNTHMIQVALAQ